MARTTDTPLDVEAGERTQVHSTRRRIPDSWARLGEARRLDEAGDWFYAVEISVERYERHVRQSPTEVDISERCSIFVRYATADGERALQARYAGALIEGADGVGAVPKAARSEHTGAFWSRILCADPADYGMAAPPKPDDAEQVRAIYDLDAEAE